MRLIGRSSSTSTSIQARHPRCQPPPPRDLHGLSALGRRVAEAAGTYLSPFERAVLHPSLHNISACLGSLNLALTVLGLGCCSSVHRSDPPAWLSAAVLAAALAS